MSEHTYLRVFNRHHILGTCRRVEQRTNGPHCKSIQNRGMTYLTPLERRVDELLARSRPRT